MPDHLSLRRTQRPRAGEFRGFWCHDAAGVKGLTWDAAIERLAPGYRMVLVLHDVEGFTHEEIALQLGIAPGTSKAQLFKARRAMRALLTGRENQDVS